MLRPVDRGSKEISGVVIRMQFCPKFATYPLTVFLLSFEVSVLSFTFNFAAFSRKNSSDFVDKQYHHSIYMLALVLIFFSNNLTNQSKSW